mmetsp:Transcript_7400/g.14013  ORF Transcript_7400/g.14013 Transcript_7400/m.14013 type:complete len:919 (-) Transcript_7400:240-2996(-)
MGKKKKNKEPSKTRQGHTSYAIPPVLPKLSKLVFLMLSLGGYFNATNYSDFLESFPAEIEIHDENTMDDVMNAMEFHEQHRMKLANTLRLLADAMIDSISTESKVREVEIGLKYFQKVDEIVSDVVTETSLYQSLLLKQEQGILNFRRDMKNINKRNHPDLFPSYFLRYVLLFEELVQQYTTQIRWEKERVYKINEKLQDGSVYFPLSQEEELKEAGLCLQRNLKVWAGGIENCAMLDGEFWLNVQRSVLQEFMFSGASIGDGVTEDSTFLTESYDETIIPCPSENFHRSAQKFYLSHALIDNPIDLSSIDSVVDGFLSRSVLQDYQRCGNSLEERSERELLDEVVFGKPLFLLLTGPPGTGKTHFCNQIEARIARYNKDSNESKVIVICPRFTADFVKPFVGGFEDSLLSLFCYATSICPSKKCVLLLDGVDEFFVESVQNTYDATRDSLRRSHLSFRTRNLFFDILDKLRSCKTHQRSFSLSNLLVICTSTTADENVRDRFHKVFHLGEPNEDERKLILEHCLQKPKGEMTQDLMDKLEELVTDTVGKSRGDLAQYCRDAIDVIPGLHDSFEAFSSRLDIVKKSVTTILPESIRSISGEGFVNMTVSSARELLEEVEFDENGSMVFPLFGDNAKYCWAQLQNLIVSPLCRRKKLDRLLYGDTYHSEVGGERNPGNAGVLLTGPPGIGKSVMARYCAAYAASLDANIRLIEVPCTSLIHKELGSSERCVHKLFQAVQAAAPCILVLDGIENIAPARGHDNTSEGTMDRLLSTLLIEMDGVSRVDEKSNDSGIAVIGITHNPISWIDPALLRPGRLEKCIYMGKPCVATRKKIYSEAIKNLKIDFSGTGLFDPKDEHQLADMVAMTTRDRSAADIIALCNNAKIQVLRGYLHDADKASELSSRQILVPYYHFLGRPSK